MSAQGGANFVRYYFYRGSNLDLPEQQRLVALAYACARQLQLAPSKILIRSALHRTTSIGGGRYGIDEKGWHMTLAFKNANQVNREVHYTSHGYTAGKDVFVLREAIHRGEKPDDTPRGNPELNKVVWPVESELEEYEANPIAYSHLPDPKVNK